MGERLFGGIRGLLKTYGRHQKLNHTASLGCLYFTEDDVYNYETAKTSDTEAFADYFRFMLEHGIHLGPSQFEAMFISNAHTETVIDQTLNVVKQYFESRV